MLEQHRALWDQLLIHRGLAALARAEELNRTLGRTGTYTLQAAISACHVRALHTADATDWPRIAALYSALSHVAPSPIVELNRAVAVGMAEGPAAGLAIIDAIASEPALELTTCSPASARTSSTSLAAMTKPAPNSSAPPH